MHVAANWSGASRWLWNSTVMHWVWAGAVAGFAALSLQMRRQARLQAAERWRERRIREELEAYAGLDPSIAQGLHAGMDAMEAARALAKRVCRAIADKSAFTRVALLLRNPEGRF